MKSIRKAISNTQARQLIESLSLVVGSSFTNTTPSDLCYEYRVVSGYFLEEGNAELLRRSTTKDNDGNLVTQDQINLSRETFGVYEDDAVSEGDMKNIKDRLQVINALTGLDIKITDII